MANIYLDNFDGKCPFGNIEEQISKNREKFFENHNKKQTKKYAPGEVFGHLTIIDYLGCLRGRKDASLIVLCDCGSISEIHANTLYGLQRDGKDICCTKCRGEKKRASKYEIRVQDMLKHLQVHYTREYRVFDCKNPITNIALSFDFYLPDYNAFIEVNGSQHFYDWTLSADTLSYRIYKDVIKAEYCRNNGYKLISVNADSLQYLTQERLFQLIIK